MSFLTNLIPAPYRWLAFALVALALVGFGWVKGAQHGERKLDAYKLETEKATVIQAQKVAQVRSDLLSDAIVLEGVKDEQIKIIDGKLAAARADGMRLRAERREPSPAITSACKGATGSELSRPDAGFLSEQAARADRLRAALAQCYDQYDKARDALEKLANTKP